MVNGTWSWQLEIEFPGGGQAPGRCCTPARGRLLSVRGLYCCAYVREIKVTFSELDRGSRDTSPPRDCEGKPAMTRVKCPPRLRSKDEAAGSQSGVCRTERASYLAEAQPQRARRASC